MAESNNAMCDEAIQRACSAIDDAYLAKELNNQSMLQHRSKRKRTDNNDTTTLDEKLHKFKHSPYYLRIPASSVAALCGLHPFQNLPQVLFDYVYQSYMGQLLLQQDAQLLGLTLVDAKSYEQEQMMNLASAASTETKALVQQVLEVSEGKRKLQSIDDVQSIQKQIKSQAAKAHESGKLSKKQVETLVEASRGHVATGFGTCHEDEALDVYETRVGCTVRERNEALMEWRFSRVEAIDDSSNELGVTAIPMGDAKRKVWNNTMQVINNEADQDKKMEASTNEEQGRAKEEPIEIAMNVDNTAKLEKEKAASSSAVIIDKPKPFFRIVGAVDGVRDELYYEDADLKQSNAPASVNCTQNHTSKSNDNQQQAQNEYNFSDDEEEQWSLRPIIVECKHRMNEAKVPPPLYDQIQTCLYCHMYKVEEADLIQVVRRRKEDKHGEEKENDVAVKSGNEGADADGKPSKSKSESTSDKKVGSNKKQDMSITITRVSLNDPIHNHNHHWIATLLPRIASFVDAVYNIRKDDGKRYRLLMAFVQSQQEENGGAEKDSWKLLWDECPWLIHCDTAFGKRRRF